MATRLSRVEQVERNRATVLGARSAEALAAAGLDGPEVRVRSVRALERHAATGKLRRFVPLA